MRIDLHLHTTASDGQHTPAELIRLVRQQHLDVIAITDHDTTDAIREATRTAAAQPIILPGIELSAEDEAGDVHMLGYHLKIDHPPLQAKLSEFRDLRENRGRRIVERLGELGLPVAWERVEAIADGAGIGRPHIARAMVEAGYVGTVRAAFDRYLYNGGPAYVSRYRLSPEDAIALIHDAGGAAVLAHPGLLADYRAMVQRLVPAGLDGVEVWHPENNETVRLNLRALAAEHHLIMTGGSDFHGDAISSSIPGSTNPPDACIAQLQERAQRYR
jgi:predicted metal-dependent phosphoesterase TrpH